MQKEQLSDIMYVNGGFRAIIYIVFLRERVEYDMKILFATSEATPFMKTGGLGDVAGTLPGELNKIGADARVIMPLYNGIPQEYKYKMTYVNHIYIDMAWRKQYCGVFELVHNGTKFYFIDNKFYFSGNNPYSYIHEDVEKFIFFSKAALSILPTIDFRPDVINCNDWQTGPIPVFLDVFQDNPFYRGIKTVMTIHNLKFQGRWDFKGIKDVMGISDYYFTSDKLEYYKDANLLKGGLVYADRISTVSESYAHEITTPEYGEGLNGLLSARSHQITGIVNGISYDEYNPETDNDIYEKYNKRTVFTKKKIDKQRLQEELNLPQDPNKFMIGIVSRLTDQKGFDILAQALEQICQDNIQVVVLGTGEEHFENMFRHFAWKYPDKISANIYFSNQLAHKIYAGCDAFLMPSRFEPCGLSQLISLRYGTVPIVRETGGLKDTVVPYNEYDGEGTGFSFSQYSANDMLHVIRYAHSIYTNTDAWNGIIKNGMSTDFSWKVSAQKYMQMYRDITGIQEEQKNDDNNNVEKKTKSTTRKSTKSASKTTTKKTAAKKTTKKAEVQKEEVKPEVEAAVKPAEKKKGGRTKKTAETEQTVATAPVKEAEKAEEKVDTAKQTEEKKAETTKKAADTVTEKVAPLTADKTEVKAETKAAAKNEKTATPKKNEKTAETKAEVKPTETAVKKETAKADASVKGDTKTGSKTNDGDTKKNEPAKGRKSTKSTAKK